MAGMCLEKAPFYLLEEMGIWTEVLQGPKEKETLVELPVRRDKVSVVLRIMLHFSFLSTLCFLFHARRKCAAHTYIFDFTDLPHGVLLFYSGVCGESILRY